MQIDLDARSRAILHHIVDAFIETGEPVGSKTLSTRLGVALSPATIRNIMAELVDAGLLYSPHTSAGRLPTEAGLRFFVHGLLELGPLASHEKVEIENRCHAGGKALSDVLEEATAMLSGLSQCAGLVVAPKMEQALKHMEFVAIGPGRALVVMVTDDGIVENRVIELPDGMPPAALREATNFINARLCGKSLEEARLSLGEEISQHRAQLDSLSARLVEQGLATWSGLEGALIVRGQSNLLRDVTQMEDLDTLRNLFSVLDARESLMSLLDAASQAEGVQIFIGAESNYFNVAGCSVIVAPYLNAKEQIIGAIGVVGPTRMNYGKIIPMVDYTAKMITRLLTKQIS